MNRKQKIIIGVGAVIVLTMGLFPPWVITHGPDILLGTGTYAPIFNPPQYYGKWYYTIDATRLLIQWGMVIMTVVGLVLILKKGDRA